MIHDGKVLLARLYEKTSARGHRYFVGRLGAARVAMFIDERAEGGDPVWELFVQDGGPQEGKATTSREPVNTKPTTATHGELMLRAAQSAPGSARKSGRRRKLPDPIKAAIGWKIPDDPL